MSLRRTRASHHAKNKSTRATRCATCPNVAQGQVVTPSLGAQEQHAAKCSKSAHKFKVFAETANPRLPFLAGLPIRTWSIPPIGHGLRTRCGCRGGPLGETRRQPSHTAGHIRSKPFTKPRGRQTGPPKPQAPEPDRGIEAIRKDQGGLEVKGRFRSRISHPKEPSRNSVKPEGGPRCVQHRTFLAISNPRPGIPDSYGRPYKIEDLRKAQGGREIKGRFRSRISNPKESSRNSLKNEGGPRCMQHRTCLTKSHPRPGIPD